MITSGVRGGPSTSMGNGIVRATISSLMLIFGSLLAVCMTSVATQRRHWVTLGMSIFLWVLVLGVLFAPELI